MDCVYCSAKEGEEHKKGCVMRKKKVKVKFSFIRELEVPEDWDDDQIKFFHEGQGCYCASNLFAEIADEINNDCMCGKLKVKVFK